MMTFTVYPFTPEELNVKLEFESKDDKEDFLILDYYILVPVNPILKKLYNNDKNLLSSFNEDNKFLEFFREEMKKYMNNVNIPNIFEMWKRYNKKNGIFKEKLRNNIGINWDFETEEEDGIKCRVDKDNQINIFLQQNFFLNDTSALNVILE